jgi:hypothetical protein
MLNSLEWLGEYTRGATTHPALSIAKNVTCEIDKYGLYRVKPKTSSTSYPPAYYTSYHHGRKGRGVYPKTLSTITTNVINTQRY